MAVLDQFLIRYSPFFLKYRVSQKNCLTFDEILKNKDNMNRLMER